MTMPSGLWSNAARLWASASGPLVGWTPAHSVTAYATPAASRTTSARSVTRTRDPSQQPPVQRDRIPDTPGQLGQRAEHLAALGRVEDRRARPPHQLVRRPPHQPAERRVDLDQLPERAARRQADHRPGHRAALE